MNRRSALLALLALGVAGRGFAQPASLPRIGICYSGQRGASAVFLQELDRALSGFGYQHGKTAVIETRWAGSSQDTAEAQVRELAAIGCRVIVAQGPACHAARKINGAVPVVIAFSGNPIDAGFTSSLARPDRGMTGMTYLSLDLVGKRIQLLKEAIPSVRRIAIIANPAHPGDQSEFDASRKAADQLGLELSYHAVTKADELVPAFQAIVASAAHAIVVFPDAIMSEQRARLAELSLAQRIPTISGWAVFADAGNLLSYGPNLRSCYRRIGYYVDRILRGAQPADLPIELPRELEFVINMKTAAALGLAIPPAVMLRADRII